MRLLAFASLLVLAGCAASEDVAITPVDGPDLNGVYVSSVSGPDGFLRLRIDLRQRGDRLDGTLTVEGMGDEIRSNLSGRYSPPNVTWSVNDMDFEASFDGMAEQNGALLDGRLSFGVASGYQVRFERQ